MFRQLFVNLVIQADALNTRTCLVRNQINISVLSVVLNIFLIILTL